jgi:hypothetical protein
VNTVKTIDIYKVALKPGPPCKSNLLYQFSFQAREELSPRNMANTGLFPVLNDSINGEVTTTTFREIPCESLQKIEVFCKENKSKISLFFITVWSIVLRQYTEADILYFAVNDSNASTLGPLDEDQHRQFQDTIQTYQVSMNSETRVEDLLGNKDCRICALDHKQRPNYNTGALLATKGRRYDPGTLLDSLESTGENIVGLLFPLLTG